MLKKKIKLSQYPKPTRKLLLNTETDFQDIFPY